MGIRRCQVSVAQMIAWSQRIQVTKADFRALKKHHAYEQYRSDYSGLDNVDNT
jgi:hypothetical protein